VREINHEIREKTRKEDSFRVLWCGSWAVNPSHRPPIPSPVRSPRFSVSGKVGQTFLSAQGGAGVPPASVGRQQCPRHLAARRPRGGGANAERGRPRQPPTQLHSLPGQARQDLQRPQDTACTTPAYRPIFVLKKGGRLPDSWFGHWTLEFSVFAKSNRRIQMFGFLIDKRKP
jgi:hypothetical protein